MKENTPLVYTDPDGNFWNFVIGGVMGGVAGWQIGKAQGAKGWGMFGYIAGGAAIGAFTSGWASGSLGSMAAATPGLTTSAFSTIGAYAFTGAVAGATSGVGFAAMSGGNMARGAMWGGIIGGASGALGGFIQHQSVGWQIRSDLANRGQWMACKDCAWSIDLQEVVVKRGALDYGSPLYNALVGINDFNPLAIVVNSMFGYL